MPGKQFACQMLRLVGARTCVPAVAKLLVDEQLSHPARAVLLGLNDPAAGDALREALGKARGKLRIGLINTIGDRGDSSSVNALAALLSSGDEATTDSALAALGKIGNAPAADALDSAKVPDLAKPAWAQAYLRCAGGLAVKGQAARAKTMYRALLDGSQRPARHRSLAGHQPGAEARLQVGAGCPERHDQRHGSPQRAVQHVPQLGPRG